MILSGGSGTRLWPLSRKKYPKQFLRLSGESSFLQKTVWRNAKLVGESNIYLITSTLYYDEVKRQIPEIPECNILVEPYAKNTAPAILYALSHMQVAQDEIILVCPADHMIAPYEDYAAAMKMGGGLC